jgi:hypothetical protein
VIAGSGPLALRHNQVRRVTVEAHAQPGRFSGIITITSGDPKHPRAKVSVSGTGRQHCKGGSEPFRCAGSGGAGSE